MRGYLEFVKRSWSVVPKLTRNRLFRFVPILVLTTLMDFFGVLALGALASIGFRLSTNDNRPTRAEVFVQEHLPMSLSAIQFSTALLVLVTLLISLKSIIVLILNFRIVNVLAEEEANISGRIYTSLLLAPLDESESNSSGEVNFLSLNASSRLVVGVLLPTLNLFSDLLTILMLTLTAFIISPITTLVVLLILLSVYYILNKIVGKKSSLYGEYTKRYTILLNDFLVSSAMGLKEIRAYESESPLSYRFHANRRLLAQASQRATIINGVFRYILDISIVVLGFLAVSLQMLIENDLRRTVTTLVIFLGIAFRLIPAIQRIQSMITALRLSRPAVSSLIDYQSRTFTSRDFDFIEGNFQKTVEDAVAKPVSIMVKKISFSRRPLEPRSEWLFQDLEFSIPEGSIHVIWGASGSGKTTLLDILAGLRSPSTGKISYWTDSTQIERPSLAYVSQTPFLPLGFLNESLALGRVLDDSHVERLKFYIRELELKEAIQSIDEFFVTENGTNLSGGEKQRLSLARALASSSSILLMDEPTSSLDYENRLKIKKLLLEQAKNRTIIIATHDPLLQEIADSLTILD